MAKAKASSSNRLWALFLLLSWGVLGTKGVTIRMKNSCPFTIWPAWVSNGGHSPVGLGGSTMEIAQVSEISMPAGWGGRFWGRTGCRFDSSGRGLCDTGDCGSAMECRGAGGVPPVTLAELQLNGWGGKDFYDVSLVDGYNLPMKISPSSNNCTPAGCHSDVNAYCPLELQLHNVGGAVVGCKSACDAFKTDAFCCTGSHDRSQTCSPSQYSHLFKQHCPQAYSYAYDDSTSTFTCTSGTDYLLEFCPR